MFSSGTVTSSNASSTGFWYGDIVRCTRATEYPRVSASTRKAVMPPWARFPGSVTAKTSAKSAESPPVMKCFRPLITHASPAPFIARVWIRVASEPAPGSVRAKHVTLSARIKGKRYFSRWGPVQSR